MEMIATKEKKVLLALITGWCTNYSQLHSFESISSKSLGIKFSLFLKEIFK